MTIHHLSDWIARRLGFVARYGADPAGPGPPATWLTLPEGELPNRAGPRPEVSWSIPQQPESGNAPYRLQELLFDQVRALPGVDVGPSRISVPRGARLHPA